MRITGTQRRRAGSESSLKTIFVSRTKLALLLSLGIVSLCGCPNPTRDKPAVDVTLTESSQRAERRAFDGAPPVIPHPRLGATCTECHTATGKPVPERGFAPANPHLHTSGLSAIANCRQCHVFKNATDTFQENDFVGLVQQVDGGQAMYDGAPPVIPHPVFMRENCNACHDGPAARPEIRCDHAQRANCHQCHVAQTVGAGEFQSALSSPVAPPSP